MSSAIGIHARSGPAQVAERMAAEFDGVFDDDPAHGFRVTLKPMLGLAERQTHCFVPVPPERRAHVAQTMAVYVQPANEPWLVVLQDRARRHATGGRT